MSPARRAELIALHEELYAADELDLEQIGIIELVLLSDPDAPLHYCDDDDCIACSYDRDAQELI